MHPGNHGAILVAVLAVVLSVDGAQSATLTVTTAADVVNGDPSTPDALVANPGPDGISLREAVLAANSTPGPHTITFSPDLADHTIALTDPLLITRDGVSLLGLTGPDGQPSVTLDGQGITIGACCNALILGYASDLTITRIRFVGIRVHGIRVQAGETLYPPTPPPTLHDVHIEDNAFDNTDLGRVSFEGSLQDAIRVWTEPEGNAKDATITGVTVARNTFRRLTGNGVILAATGTNCLVRDGLIANNVFIDVDYPVELCTTTGSQNRVDGTRIVGNRIANGLVPIFIGNNVGGGTPPALGGVIEGTLISGNAIFGEYDSIDLAGGNGNAAVGNAILNTQIVNNLVVTGRGIWLQGGTGTSEPTANRVEGVRIVNNTVITLPMAGARVDSNLDGTSGNSVTGVTVVNTIFVGPTQGVTGPESEIAGEITPAQVSFSITNTPGFVGVNGNFSADPRFVDPENKDCRLQPGSPAIDRGDNTNCPATDLVGTVRPQDGDGDGRAICDLGAYEFIPSLVHRVRKKLPAAR